jgi:hypothetical protein
LLNFKGNKYVLAKAAMYAIDKVVNMKGYVEETKDKPVPNILEMVLDNRIKHVLLEDPEKDKED